MREGIKKQKKILLICNVILVLITIVAAGLYTEYTRKVQEDTKTTTFIRTIESMKQISQNYLDSERGYVKNWAGYISENEMTLEEALDFLRGINADDTRLAHIVDMDSYEAYSAYYPKGEEKIDTYEAYKDPDIEADVPFGKIMESMFAGTDEQFTLLGKYRLKETESFGVGVGTRVTLATGQGPKDYLLLRIVPVDAWKKSWVFPTEFASAEVGIITRTGDYVIQSPSMKSQNFREYIRGYNFQDNYNEIEAFRKRLEGTEEGILKYKNFRGTDCLWYYSSFSPDSQLDILGVMGMKELKASGDTWYLVGIVCSLLIVLMLLDGIYLLRMNRRLRETVRIAEQASQAKTQFLSAMSHDIRTPLNAVLGMMAIAKKNAKNPDYVAECMEKGIHSGKQLLTLINDVLDISKIESGNVQLTPEQVSLQELTGDLTDMLTPAAKQKEIALSCDFTSLPYKYVYADSMRLHQIYVNLLSNAVKYTEAGGSIQVRLYENAIPGDTLHTRLVFQVKDTGIGMTEEFQKDMYNAFSREVKTQVNRAQGTGLGLSIVKQMVDLMGGRIECESMPGKGTCFTVSINLMIMEGFEENVRERETIQDSIRGMHLLIAEDNELNWEVISELLREQGVTCEHAENGKDCIRQLTEAPEGTYTAILMDVNMPEMNGLDATRAIRALLDPGRSQIPIIAMTADAFAEDVQACIACGMNGHVAKPVDMDKLAGYLRRLCKEKS